ncbi:4-hydroxythreonine-4-phosphate dehydrogenase PdxA [Gluconobacter cerinus]|uniref:4-hydroxythreonine-4-phosphate dehydrogenase PdxA n=1 Tax=Gluconobacter cerinus TaxID=38307 RepID=UPI001B8BD515|nr:4-hydroxythreonine-4-phosphate dehydrogenase PdxA [Gluconobacter cerinus]MBS1032012.1 4-hydroxythreonine-4-phosphate dehydrogenase PdxA [Gluconobacter cerinus]
MNAPIALTLGDPAGIGPELAALAWSTLRETGPTFFWLGDPALLNDAIPFKLIEAPEDAHDVFSDALPVLPVECLAPVVPGKPDSRNAAAVIASIEQAVRYVQSGQAAGLTTNPIAKHILASAGFSFPGHTEFLAALCHCDGQEVMMLASPHLRVVPVTIHVSLRQAIESLTTERIVAVTLATHKALQSDFGITRPRLAIAGLNPHAGEEGMMGTEEKTIIGPAIAILKSQGLTVMGPFPPDTMFSATARPGYDAAICMYHDQALIPLKTLDMAEGVNVTIGLPIIRTSPDHGTAFDIAGPVGRSDSQVDPSSLLAALRLADSMSRHKKGDNR